MKKSLLLTSILLLGFIIFTGQKAQDDRRWNIPQTHVYLSGEISPYIPLDNHMFMNTKTVYLYSPNGIKSVGPNFIPFPNSNTQSEVESYANPNVPGKLFVLWNSYGGTFWGTGFALTTNTGVNWTGNYTLPVIPVNGGDPSVVINSSGKLFANALNSAYNGVVNTTSTDNGVTWTPYVTVATSSSEDKNHVTIDDKSTSPYYNYVYNSWTDFSGSTYPAKFARSTDGGVTFQAPIQITGPISGYYSQGVNLHTGPNGEVYFICAEPTTSSPYTEHYIAFAKSTNGGTSFTLNETAITVNGIRGSLKSSAIRVNSFPWMAVDKTGGLYNGNIYIVWAQKNLAPAGTDPDICFCKSTNGGSSFTTPVRVNQDPMNNGRDQYFGNICVDASGGINIDYYDSRNPTTNDSVEVYLSRSIDGGNTFTDTKISDHRFRPVPISGLAGGYQGDYIGISQTNNALYPFWADNSSGVYQVWSARIDLGPSIAHTPLGNTEQTTGTRAVNCVISPAGSGINPALTRLYYAKNSTTFTLVQLTNSGGNNWTGNITLSGAGTYNYYLTTTDSLSRTATAPAGAPAAYYSFSASADTVPPTITHTPIGPTPKAIWPISVTATVTDNLGVDSSWVLWYKNTPTVIKEFKLINTSGSTYSAVFNSINSDVVIGDHIYYVIKAVDISSNHNIASFPATGYNSFLITPLRLAEGFTNPVFPPNGWTVVGAGAADWTRETPSSYGIGVGSAKFDFWSATSGVQASLVTFTFDPTNPGDSLRFDRAHAYYNATSIDTMKVESSTNGGTTFTNVITMYSSTNFGQPYCMSTISSTSIYTPNAGDWITRAYPLPTGTNVVRFNCVSGFGNNLFIDSIITGNSTVTGLSHSGTIPIQYELSQNYPNPFNPVTKINFAIPKQGLVSIKIYDVLGREIKSLVNEIRTPGRYSVEFDASEFSSGVYFYKLVSNSFSDVKKMMLIK